MKRLILLDKDFYLSKHPACSAWLPHRRSFYWSPIIGTREVAYELCHQMPKQDDFSTNLYDSSQAEFNHQEIIEVMVTWTESRELIRKEQNIPPSSNEVNRYKSQNKPDHSLINQPWRPQIHGIGRVSNLSSQPPSLHTHLIRMLRFQEMHSLSPLLPPLLPVSPYHTSWFVSAALPPWNIPNYLRPRHQHSTNNTPRCLDVHAHRAPATPWSLYLAVEWGMNTIWRSASTRADPQ